MKVKKVILVVLMILCMFGVTACANSSDSSSSETKVVAPVEKVPIHRDRGIIPSYNKVFKVAVGGNAVTTSNNNDVVDKANTWVAKQNLREYSPHFIMYVDTEAGDANYLYENVTMVRRYN